MELSSLGPPTHITLTNHLTVCKHTDVIHHIEFDSYSRRLALVSSDKTVSIYDKMPMNKGWTKTGTFRVHGGATWKIRWAHAMYGQILATASFNGSVYIFQENSSMNDDIEERDIGLKNKAQLIEFTWKEKAHINSAKPTNITDIRFAPHFNGLILGVCNGIGQVNIYECPGPDNLDNWSLVQRMSIFKPRRCTSIAFSTDRFSTLLVAACSDDDRVRDNKNVAIFAFARTEQRIPFPEVIYFVPSADLPVHLPPVDLEFSPSGAFEFQRLAVAVGPAVILYHICVIEQAPSRPDSPLSTISENSVNTVINVPVPNYPNTSSVRTDDDYNYDDEEEESLSDVVAMDSLYGMLFSDSSKDSSKQTKKNVHFNFTPSSQGSTMSKSEVTTTFGETESDKSFPIPRIVLPTKSNSRPEPSPASPVPEGQKSLKSELAAEEEAADDADSETSEITTVSTDTKSVPSPSRARVDRRPLWNPAATPSQKSHSAIFSDDEASAPPPLIRRDFSTFTRKKPVEPPKKPEQVKIEIRRKGKPKAKRKRTPVPDNKSTDDESQSKPTTTTDTISSMSTISTVSSIVSNNTSESSAPVEAVLTAVRKLTKDRRVPNMLQTEPIPLPPPSLAVEARATPEFNIVEGRKESATIQIDMPQLSTSAEDAGVISDALIEEDDFENVQILMERKAVLTSDRSQVKRITFNQTGTLLTVVYVDGRVRVWKRVNPMLWQCVSVVDPPMIKGKEGLEITHEQAYY
uniref:WD_REPEATS_REGION domain-containing protein n=1 Tax=Panagrellus redivivus TaxID=6233 RepID=A0A7E4VXM7_PANRE